GVVPTNFDKHHFVVVRGGCWLDDARACRAAYRYRAMPATRYQLIGFRVACDLRTDGKNK
ncbi:MAG: SUMF1/EgtB/PvdO family nonheme iron enzyme, partial [Planctomycetales bacterium]